MDKLDSSVSIENNAEYPIPLPFKLLFFLLCVELIVLVIFVIPYIVLRTTLLDPAIYLKPTSGINFFNTWTLLIAAIILLVTFLFYIYQALFKPENFETKIRTMIFKDQPVNKDEYQNQLRTALLLDIGSVLGILFIFILFFFLFIEI